jgi:LmbE family N-acetylglucosaminyl deacetylase
MPAAKMEAKSVGTPSRFRLLRINLTQKRAFWFSILSVFWLTVQVFPIYAQRSLVGEPQIRQALERLDSVGSIMFIAAHPDDEDSAIIAYFSLGRHFRTAYLSLTRGEGGQNLIGSDQGDELGVIRTQELLAARRLDGGEQFFTRAIDFGFSKTADETLSKWPREKVLSDMVWNIRRFRPDVIVLNFTGTPRDGHGHHQVSAILGKEAFSAAADPSRFPEQLQWAKPWQARRLMGRTGMRGPGRPAAVPEKDTEGQVEIDVGEYSPDLGYSYAEIRGISRSFHRSQGQGSPETKGSIKTTYATLAADPATQKATKDVFEGIDTTWNRLPDGGQIGSLLDKARDTFAPLHPEQVVPLLVQARPLIAAINDPLAKGKLVELDESIALCSALSLEATADKAAVSPGGSLKVNLSALVRRPVQVELRGVELLGFEGALVVNIAPAVLNFNKPSQYPASLHVPERQPYTQPYWLELPKDGQLYSVPDPRMVGLAENPPALEARFRLRVDGAEIELTRPVDYRYVDQIYGEQHRPLAIVPPLGLDLPESSLVFPSSTPRRIEVAVKANQAHVSGDAHLAAPQGWMVQPASIHFDLSAAGDQSALAFEITPPSAETRGDLHALAMVGDRSVSSSTELIQYPHIPVQILFPPAESKLVRADIRTLSKNIGYVMGAGDEIPGALRQIGCDVTLLSAEDLTRGDLSRFDAIVTGVRAFNTRADLRANYRRVFDYTQNGGTVVVQYNFIDGPDGATVQLEHVGPYPMRLTRDRVTMEDAPVTFPNPQISLLHAPNEITNKDFEGWVQERGLYFATDWDPKYQPVIESHDPGEQPLLGGELYLRYGKGVYIFSAYSWFRQLPAGVPGAYRLFANMLSAGKAQQ